MHATVKVGQSACNEWSPDKGRSLAFRAPAIEASAKAKADTCDAVGLHMLFTPVPTTSSCTSAVESRASFSFCGSAA